MSVTSQTLRAMADDPVVPRLHADRVRAAADELDAVERQRDDLLVALAVHAGTLDATSLTAVQRGQVVQALALLDGR